MKFRVCMKDPGTLHDAVNEAVREELASLGLHPDEVDLVADSRSERVRNICEKWFKYGEYLEVEIDTEKQTCLVIDKD